MPLTLPTGLPAPRAVEWQPNAAVVAQRSPFTHARKVTAWAGQSWTVIVQYPPMTRANALALQAFFLRLNGPENTFYFADTLHAAPLGVGVGYPLVAGASQTGTSLDSDGWQSNTEGILRAGDWISLNDRLYRVTQDADSDATGAAMLNIWPALITPDDDAVISIGADARGTFYLEEIPSVAFDETKLARAGITFTAHEAL